MKYAPTKSSLETFLLYYLSFPFSLMADDSWQRYDLVDRGVLKLIENIDELKNSNQNFRFDCLGWSLPAILSIFAGAVGLTKVASFQDAIPNFTLIILNAVTLVICWRFGNKLRNFE